MDKWQQQQQQNTDESIYLKNLEQFVANGIVIGLLAERDFLFFSFLFFFAPITVACGFRAWFDLADPQTHSQICTKSNSKFSGKNKYVPHPA
jgi:hypothetical protein